MRSYSQMNRVRSFTISLVGRFVALLILSAVALTSIPLADSFASSMPCCAGKAHGHCESGIAAPKPPPPPGEPMCGLTKSQTLTAESLDAVTVVAETDSDASSLLNAEATSSHTHATHAESNATRVTAESISKPCRMDCGACATATSRHQRQRTTLLARFADAAPLTATSLVENSTPLFSSNENWTRISPRGPPARS
jgi:hypothetical protein